MESYLIADQKLWHKTRRTNANSQEAALEKEYQQISSQKECAIMRLNTMLHLIREGNHMNLFSNVPDMFQMFSDV